jgi:hypothetical protein
MFAPCFDLRTPGGGLGVEWGFNEEEAYLWAPIWMKDFGGGGPSTFALKFSSINSVLPNPGLGESKVWHMFVRPYKQVDGQPRGHDAGYAKWIAPKTAEKWDVHRTAIFPLTYQNLVIWDGDIQNWVENSQILQCTYNADPPVPEEDIPTVGVELEIIANSNVNPQAVSKFMEVLYNSSIENVIKQTLTEESGDSLSQYPLSAGAVVYINRNEPFFSMDKLDSLKNLFGSLMAGLSTLMVVVKWFRGGRKKEEDAAEADDREEEIPIEGTPDVKVSEEEIETVNNKQ